MATKKEKAAMSVIFSKADVLAEQHVNYTEQFVTRANVELYRLLGEMLDVCLQIEKSGIRDSIIKQMRTALKEKYNLKTQANSRTSAIVVRYVTGASRKTAHVYGRVLDTAIAEGIAPADLPDFIKAKNGIDAIRQSVASAEEKKQNAANLAMDYKALKKSLYAKGGVATVQATSPNMSLELSASDVSFTYLACTKDWTTGKLKVVATLYPSTAVEQHAFNCYLTACMAAALSDRNEFYDYCKQNGLNEELVRSFMKSNAIANAAQAKAFLKGIYSAPQPDAQAIALGE